MENKSLSITHTVVVSDFMEDGKILHQRDELFMNFGTACQFLMYTSKCADSVIDWACREIKSRNESFVQRRIAAALKS